MVVAGNHDLLFYQKPKLARANLTQATYLQDSGVTIEGLNFWGSPVNSVGEGWAFSRDRMVKIRKHWDRIPDDTDVLITHEPPCGTLDKIHIPAMVDRSVQSARSGLEFTAKHAAQPGDALERALAAASTS